MIFLAKEMLIIQSVCICQDRFVLVTSYVMERYISAINLVVIVHLQLSERTDQAIILKFFVILITHLPGLIP